MHYVKLNFIIMSSVFSYPDVSAILSLFYNGSFEINAKKKRFCGKVDGIVKFELVKCPLGFALQRTYLPKGFWKKATVRYVSLDAFINECRMCSCLPGVLPNDDLSFYDGRFVKTEC